MRLPAGPVTAPGPATGRWQPDAIRPVAFDLLHYLPDGPSAMTFAGVRGRRDGAGRGVHKRRFHVQVRIKYAVLTACTRSRAAGREVLRYTPPAGATGGRQCGP